MNAAVLARILLVVLCSWLVFVACGGLTKPVLMRNPKTGETGKCGPYPTGPRGAMSYQKERDCISDFQRQGWERVPD
jgi:hypothetical protein